jgi:hypothetical protein
MGNWYNTNNAGDCGVNSHSTYSYVNNYLTSSQNPAMQVDYATNWWVGDFDATTLYGHTHYSMQGPGGDDTWDYNVYQINFRYLPRCNKQYFKFIWTCVNGGIQWNGTGGQNTINGLVNNPLTQTPQPTHIPTNNNSYYGWLQTPEGVAGMPYAWTGQLSMSNPYCYIGWQNHSPWMQDQPPVWGAQLMAYFPMDFYDKLTSHWSVLASLNYASNLIYGVDFSISPIHLGWWDYNALGDGMTGWWYCQMMIYGNSGLTLPT